MFYFFISRFRCLLSTLCIMPERVRSVALCCCVLHNMLRSPDGADMEDSTTHEVIPGAWRDGGSLESVQGGTGRLNIAAKRVREQLRNYYNSPSGSVPWQEDMI